MLGKKKGHQHRGGWNGLEIFAFLDENINGLHQEIAKQFDILSGGFGRTGFKLQIRSFLNQQGLKDYLVVMALRDEVLVILSKRRRCFLNYPVFILLTTDHNFLKDALWGFNHLDTNWARNQEEIFIDQANNQIVYRAPEGLKAVLYLLCLEGGASGRRQLAQKVAQALLIFLETTPPPPVS